MAVFKSSLEISVAKDLEEKGVVYEYETEKFPYTLHRTYKPDFILPNGIYIEAKGWHKGFADTLRKLRAIKDQYPELDLRIVWSKLTIKATKAMTVEQWSIKYGFKYAEKFVPQDWINE